MTCTSLSCSSSSALFWRFLFLLAACCAQIFRDSEVLVKTICFPSRRPARTARAFRQIGEDKRIAARHREQAKLRRLRFPILLLARVKTSDLPSGDQRAPPSCGPFVSCRGGALASGRDQPERSVVAFFFLIHRHAGDKHDLRSIRRDLRVADPDEIEKILFGDVALLLRAGGRSSLTGNGDR